MRPSTYYIGVTGIIENISPFADQCCNYMISIRTLNGLVNFVLSPGTFVTDNTIFRVGNRVTAFYDANLPVPLIYPPQYQAAFISRIHAEENCVVGYFDGDLLSIENSLKLNIDNSTQITTANGQPYTCDLGDNLLMVYFTFTTASIPAQTTPMRIIVFC